MLTWNVLGITDLEISSAPRMAAGIQGSLHGCLLNKQIHVAPSLGLWFLQLRFGESVRLHLFLLSLLQWPGGQEEANSMAAAWEV